MRAFVACVSLTTMSACALFVDFEGQGGADTSVAGSGAGGSGPAGGGAAGGGGSGASGAAGGEAGNGGGPAGAGGEGGVGGTGGSGGAGGGTGGTGGTDACNGLCSDCQSCLNGACVNHPVGEQCGMAMCNGAGVETPRCNASGQCQGMLVPCEMGHTCMNAVCMAKANGETCSSSTECVSEKCIDGRCCDEDCDGPCESCANNGSLGVCSPVTFGMEPLCSVCSPTNPPTYQPGSCSNQGICQSGVPEQCPVDCDVFVGCQ